MGDNWRLLCRYGNIEEVQAAIDNGANVNLDGCEDTGGTTGLMLALDENNINVVQLVLNHPQTDINKVDEDGYCALHWAVGEDNHEGLAALLARQDLTTINQRDNEGRTPIMKAVQQRDNRVNCFNLLLAHPEVDLDTRDDYRRNAKEVRR